MKQYNYEARNEDKQNNYPKVAQSEDLNAKVIPVYEQLSDLEYAIEKLTELQGNLIKRLEWVSNPSERPLLEPCGNEIKTEREDSEIVHRIKKSVRNIKELQYKLSNQLEDLDV
jgi:hypothetical protein